MSEALLEGGPLHKVLEIGTGAGLLSLIAARAGAEVVTCEADPVVAAREIADRSEAIRQAVAGLERGDVLLVAGKGHETGQIIGDKILHFSDHEAVAAALASRVA